MENNEAGAVPSPDDLASEVVALDEAAQVQEAAGHAEFP